MALFASNSVMDQRFYPMAAYHVPFAASSGTECVSVCMCVCGGGGGGGGVDITYNKHCTVKCFDSGPEDTEYSSSQHCL